MIVPNQLEHEVKYHAVSVVTLILHVSQLQCLGISKRIQWTGETMGTLENHPANAYVAGTLTRTKPGIKVGVATL